MKFLIGKKLGMTTLFDENKGALNVTLIACEENEVTLHRTPEKNGYLAVQVMAPRTKRIRARQEFRLDRYQTSETSGQALEAYPTGAKLSVEMFSVGEKVNVSGITKAKGFQGVVKRHGFRGAPASHGRKHDMRKPGSIGATFPEHVVKGRRMAGRMGGVSFTVRNLSVAYVDVKEGLIGVRGAVPGVNGRLVSITGVAR